MPKNAVNMHVREVVDNFLTTFAHIAFPYVSVKISGKVPKNRNDSDEFHYFL